MAFVPQYTHAAELRATAKAMVAPGKGLLAADESTGTIGKRLSGINVDNTRENRVAYRELLFRTPGVGQHISGVILYDETFRDKCGDGSKMLIDLLKEQGIIPGIKVDKGVQPMPFTDGETVTEGLDGLAESRCGETPSITPQILKYLQDPDNPARCAEYYSLGARFAKWRAVLKIDEALPSINNVVEQCHTLARYAAICQEAGLVPIVEPEILRDGTHTLARCQEVTEQVHRELFAALVRQNVLLEGLILKPNMVTPGASASIQASMAEIATATLDSLIRTIPATVPGIMFLSGGQSDEESTANLDAMACLDGKLWTLSFSYGRGLQRSVLTAWQGNPANVLAAQRALLERTEANSLAQLGKYSESSIIFP